MHPEHIGAPTTDHRANELAAALYAVEVLRELRLVFQSLEAGLGERIVVQGTTPKAVISDSRNH